MNVVSPMVALQVIVIRSTAANVEANGQWCGTQEGDAESLGEVELASKSCERVVRVAEAVEEDENVGWWTCGGGGDDCEAGGEGGGEVRWLGCAHCVSTV